MLAMFRQSVDGRLGGYEDLNDAERLRVDPTMRHVVGGRAIDKSAASTSEMGRFETEILSQRENVKLVMSLPGKFVDRVHTHKRLNKLILVSVSQLVQSLKGKTSRKMMQEYKSLSKVFWGRHIWARGYFVVSSGNVTDEVIIKYIENQGKEPQDGDFKIDE